MPCASASVACQRHRCGNVATQIGPYHLHGVHEGCCVLAASPDTWVQLCSCGVVSRVVAAASRAKHRVHAAQVYTPCRACALCLTIMPVPTLINTQALLQEKWDKIFFTGSTRVASLIEKAVAGTLTPLCFELGGKSPCIVDSSASTMDRTHARSAAAASCSVRLKKCGLSSVLCAARYCTAAPRGNNLPSTIKPVET